VKKVLLYVFISTMMFSTMEVVLKLAANHLDAFQLTLVRFAIGGLFLLPFAIIEIRRNHTVISLKDFLYLSAMGILCICISMVIFQIGVEHSKASSAAVIFCINPMFTLLFAHFITDEKLNRKKVLSLVFGLLGIVFMANPFQMEQGNTVLGLLGIIGAALTFGLYSAMGKRTIARIRGITQTCITFLVGTIVMAVFTVISGRPIVAGITTDNILMVLYVGVMITGCGYIFYFKAMEASDAATASIVFFLKPVVAPVIAVIALREAIHLNGIIGIVLILVGSYINLRGSGRKSKDAVDAGLQGMPEAAEPLAKTSAADNWEGSGEYEAVEKQ